MRQIGAIGILVIAVAAIASLDGCGTKEPGQYRTWPEAQAEAIAKVQALVDGVFTVEYKETAEGAVFTVQGTVCSELDLNVVKEGLEKLDPPLPLVFSLTVDG